MCFDPCQFYYIYQGESTQHGGRAPQLRKLKSKIRLLEGRFASSLLR